MRAFSGQSRDSSCLQRVRALGWLWKAPRGRTSAAWETRAGRWCFDKTKGFNAKFKNVVNKKDRNFNVNIKVNSFNC